MVSQFELAYDAYLKESKSIKKKPKGEDKGLVFDIIKYSVAILPIIIPFIVSMIVTNNDIIYSIFVTLFIDICIVVMGAVYFFKNSNQMEKYR